MLGGGSKDRNSNGATSETYSSRSFSQPKDHPRSLSFSKKEFEGPIRSCVRVHSPILWISWLLNEKY